jgi:predicted nucleic acid-binding protein
MTFKKYVFDTNVLVSAVLLSGSRAQSAFDYALDTGYLLVSEETLLELREVLSRSKFKKYKSLEDRMFFYQKNGFKTPSFTDGFKFLNVFTILDNIC